MAITPVSAERLIARGGSGSDGHGRSRLGDRLDAEIDVAWLHVDGAFGLWAAASPHTYPLVEGIELADSWACDGHKWLNVPYDAGYAFCAHPSTRPQWPIQRPT